MANQLCFVAAHELGNQQQSVKTQGLNKQPKADSLGQTEIGLKKKFVQTCERWALKRGEQAVKNGWG